MAGSDAPTLCDIACELGEGPTYDPATNTLFWFDIVGRKLFEMPFPDGPVTVHELPVMASALAVVDEGRQLLATETGLQLRDVATGALTMVREIEADRPETRSNDARVHPCGAFWVSTMGRKAEKKAGSIYWYFRGELRQLYPDITIPNAICFSPDGATAYFAETARNLLYRVACDPETGLPVGEPALLLDHRGQKGGIDGAVCDADGLLWNARWGAGRLDGYRPDGSHVTSYDLPATQTSCPAFAGAHAEQMAVTSAWQNMDEKARAADPQAGQLFLVAARFRGRFEPKAVL